MKKIFTIFAAMLLTAGAFAASEPAWYNDVTSITANGEYFIYSVNGKGFVQSGQSSVKALTHDNYSSTTGFLFTITAANDGKVYNGLNYLSSYQLGTCGPVGNSSTSGSDIIWTLLGSGAYWNIHGHYTAFLAERWAALYYDGDYAATANITGGKADQTDTKYRWYVISQAHYDRHFAIYFYDVAKEGLTDYTKYENKVPTAYYARLKELCTKSFDVTDAANTKEVVEAAQTEMETLYNNAAAVQAAYATAKAAIKALEDVEDKGEDFADVTTAISNAKTAVDAAMNKAAVEASVAGLKKIDPITFTVTEFTALQPLGTPASTKAGRAITYVSADKTVIDAEGKPIHKGTTKLTATAAATAQYYKFVRSANVTVVALPTSAEENKTIKYGDDVKWNGIALKDSTVGEHKVVYVTENAQGGVHTITLNLTVTKMEKLTVNVSLIEFCEGGSETFHGKTYTEAVVNDKIEAIGETRDTLYIVNVKVNQPTSSEEEKKMIYGADETWNGIALKDSAVGDHIVVYKTTNVAGCDSTVTLKLKVLKQDVVPVTKELEFCEGDSAEYRGVWYKVAGESEIEVTGIERDTLITVKVTVLLPSASEEEKTIVYGADEEWNGIALKDSTVGVHKVVYETKNAAGCDSIVTLTLTVEKQEALKAEQELEFCEGDSVEFRGKWYKEAGKDTVLAEGVVRDTIIAVAITVNAPEYKELKATVTVGDKFDLPAGEWELGDQKVSGTYEVKEADLKGLEFVQKGETKEGCESVVKLIVTVEPKKEEGIENLFTGEPAEKIFRNGIMYIRRGEALFTVTGERVE